MSEIDSGGAAFPTDGESQVATHLWHFSGLTKREWFAGMALQVITKNISLEDFVSLQPQELADGAFKIADSMIRAGKGE